MTASSVSESQEIQVLGGFVVPRRLGLATVGSVVVVALTLFAFGVRADERISALEKITAAQRLRRMERALCAICVSNPATVGNPACEAICSEE